MKKMSVMRLLAGTVFQRTANAQALKLENMPDIVVEQYGV